jgi:acyl-CoA thioesterase FadM
MTSHSGGSSRRVVLPCDLDELGHVGFLTYQRWADEELLAKWRRVCGNPESPQEPGAEFVTVEVHVRYLAELREGDAFSVDLSFSIHDSKRFIAVAVLERDTVVVCIVETLGLGFDSLSRRVTPWSPRIASAMAAESVRDAWCTKYLSGFIRLPKAKGS